MLKSGLVSISFRNLKPNEIINIVRTAGLEAIEWGGDIHVPPGNKMIAEEIRANCTLSGIKCPSFGSYYKVGEYEDPKSEFSKVLVSALGLGSEVIRVWAGVRATANADKDYWELIINELMMICDMAENEGLSIGLEFHGNTLTDNATDTLKLLAKTNRENLFTYWQPPVGRKHEDNLHDIRILKNHIKNVHTFTWDGRERLFLVEGYDRWVQYFRLIKTWNPRYCMLEFVKDNSIDSFYRDAKILKEMLKKVNNE